MDAGRHTGTQHVVHTLHLYPGWAGSSPAQPRCWSEVKNIPAPQTQLCAFTDSHCVAHSNTCTYFSMVSISNTTQSLSVCVIVKFESGNQQAQENSTCKDRAGIALKYCWDIILKSTFSRNHKQHNVCTVQKNEEMKSLTDEAHIVHGLSKWGDGSVVKSLMQ